MKALRWIAILLACYVGLVALFESLIGYLQPASESTLVITTTAADGTTHDRVVSRLESGEQLYVAANHWPRAWYERALANPQVRATIAGETRAYRAVSVSGEEHERIGAEHPLPAAFRFLTGFPPRLFLRLDPEPAAG